jgi:hypothetical protein
MWGMKLGDAVVEVAQRIVVERPQDRHPDTQLFQAQLGTARRREEPRRRPGIPKAGKEIENFEAQQVF